jgi:Phage integrase family
VSAFLTDQLRGRAPAAAAYPDSAYVFVSERKTPLCADAVRKIVGRPGREAGIEFPVHPHMLRHATGYKLANDGQDTRAIQHYLGHRNIQHTTRYTELAADRFKDFCAISPTPNIAMARVCPLLHKHVNPELHLPRRRTGHRPGCDRGGAGVGLELG